jgi:hypothetical protein
MKTIDQPNGMDPKLKAELQEVCDRVARSETFSQKERKAAAAEIDRLREENRKKFGIQNVAVDFVRQSRDSR